MLKNLYAMELYKLWKNKRFLLFLFLLLLCNIGFLSYETWGQQGAETTAYQKLSTHLQTLSSDERFTYLQGHAHDVELAFVREQIRNLKTQHDPQAEMRIVALRDQFPELDQSGTIPSLYTGDLEAENAFLQPIIKQADTANMIKYGVIVLSALPMLIIYPFLQKYFEQGVMIGSVKG